MAGDWTPLRDNIHDDPAIYAMAEMLHVRDPDLIVGKVTRLWAWASQHSSDGILEGVNRSRIDGITKKKGMADALLAAGWLEENADGVLLIPRFDRWMSQGAKARMGEATRKRIQRSVPKESGEVSGQKRDHRTEQDRTEQERTAAVSKTPSPSPEAEQASPPSSGTGGDHPPPLLRSSEQRTLCSLLLAAGLGLSPTEAAAIAQEPRASRTTVLWALDRVREQQGNHAAGRGEPVKSVPAYIRGLVRDDKGPPAGWRKANARRVLAVDGAKAAVAEMTGATP